jgi:hypothetical protein
VSSVERAKTAVTTIFGGGVTISRLRSFTQSTDLFPRRPDIFGSGTAHDNAVLGDEQTDYISVDSHADRMPHLFVCAFHSLGVLSARPSSDQKSAYELTSGALTHHDEASGLTPAHGLPTEELNMPLMRPAVVGPLSELSSSIRVRGQLVGATVTIQSGARTVAKGVATSGDQRFPLLGGLKLSRHEAVFAVQSTGSDQSDIPSASQHMPIGPAPSTSADFGLVHVATHLYACGKFVWVDGAIPGATVTLLADGNPIGTGVADEGTARLSLTTAIPSASSLVAHQSSAGLTPGPDVSYVADEIPGGRGRPLSAPIIELPVRGCDASIQVHGVFDGALVTLERRSGFIESAGFDRNAERLILGKHLDEDDQLTIRQEVDLHCERRTTNSAPLTVGKLEPVDAPQIVTPLCAGATVVRVTGLRPGATVHLAASKTVYDGTVPPDQTWFDCHVPPLTTDPVSATQELCGVMSAPAVPVTVDPHEANVRPPEVLGPVFSCTGGVSVTNAHRGALLQVFVRSPLGSIAISDQVLTLNTNIVIGVSPLLTAGTEVFVRQWACSEISVDSKREPVVAHPQPGPVETLGPIIQDDHIVSVRGAVPGAVVEVYAIGNGADEYLGSAPADALHAVTPVGLVRALQGKEIIFARQRLCGQLSDPLNRIVVIGQAHFGPRPFYVVGHNPNTLKDAIHAVNTGANGLEPDVQVYEDHPEQLCISHGTGESSAPSLVTYLDGLHTIAHDHSGLALVVFDCKQEVTSPDHGFELLMAIRKHLTFDNDLNVIISIGNRDDNQGSFFDRIVDLLGPREGLMIDAENDPGAVSNYFTSRGVTNQGYGNGISFMNFVLGPYYRYTLEGACGDRAQAGRPKFIYAWTVNVHDELREYIRIGVDGAITDDPNDLRNIAAEAQFASLIRIADRSDNPFKPANFSYGLHIKTGDKWQAGTDANLTFTLHGSTGSCSKTINAELIKRMESDDWNWVTIPSEDIGALQSITVQRDNQGNAPDWYLDRIDVRSARFGTAGTAVFDRWIDSTSPFTVSLV